MENKTSFWSRHKWLKWILIVISGLIVIITGATLASRQYKNVDESNLPKFIQANVIDPSLVPSVSKFRSGAGHSNPGWPETCRSMKHYINTFDPHKPAKSLGIDPKDSLRSQRPTAEYALDVYSPVDGRLSKSSTGEGDDQLNISVDGYRGFSIRLEHVHLNPDMGKFNAKVSAGQKIATIWNSQNFDLSVYYHYYHGDELFSYFEVLPDNLFAAWQAQGAASPSDFIFTKEYRDAHPLTCLSDRKNTPSFADSNGQITENWIPENFVVLNDDKNLPHGMGQSNNPTNNAGGINDFNSCAELYPILLTYPEQCKTPDGRTFTKS